jgi:microsomal epoxide hydrolase
MSVQPFEIRIEQAEIDLLRARLRNARWIDLPAPNDWSAGIGADFLREVASAWQDFDWRALERRLNDFGNVLVEVEGKSLHALHRRSSAADAVPILLIHGWPGSFLEFTELVEPLCRADAGGAFHVVCPSIPGYGFSAAAAAPGMNATRIAELFAAMMTALGYEKFYVQGGDWGSLISTRIAELFPERCLGLHLNMVAVPKPEGDDALALVEPHELPWLEQNAEYWNSGSGYYAIQSTRPHTPAYALNDSPLGLAAWIGEKFMAWSDCGTHFELGMPLPALLANLSLYWYTQSIGSSMRLYREEAMRRTRPRYIEVPTGGALFPRELVKAPRRWAERVYNIVHWQRYERGGHFAAMEVPDLLIADIRRFRRTVEQLPR